MKKFVCVLLCLCMAAGLAALPAAAGEELIQVTDDIAVSAGYDWTRFKGQNVSLNVYNWGLYISDGSDESVDVLAAFQELTGIKVNYTTYDTNESMYAKLKSGGASYDVIVPSDYMIGKMVNEDMLEPLDMANIPNFASIGAAYKGQSYDPADAYSVPYMWGLVGIVYNSTMVSETPDSWAALWDEQYANSVLMFNNSRDAFAIAAKKLGMSLNPRSTEDVNLIAEELKAQKYVVQAYVMDEIFDKMEGGEAALAPYYAGDAIVMMDENPDLGFVIPKEGTNYFVDAMCIPKGAANKENAEAFINFMCTTQAGIKNCEEIWYSSPLLSVREELDPEVSGDKYAYPDASVLAKCESYTNLPADILDLYASEWLRLKN